MTSTELAHTRSRRRRWLISLVAALVLAPLVLIGCAALFLFVSLGGGLDNLLDSHRPEPGDREVRAALDVAQRRLTQRGAISTRAAVTALPAGSRQVGVGWVWSCREGQHNFKIDDSYDLACVAQRRAVVAVPSGTSFRADMMALDTALRADGWQAPRGSYSAMDWMLTEYWDKLAGPFPGSPSGDVAYSPQDLPGVSYTRSGADGTEETLGVQWVEHSSPATALTSYSDMAFTSRGASAEPADILAQLSTTGYGVTFGVSYEFFNR